MENSIIELLEKLDQRSASGGLHHLKIYGDGSGQIEDTEGKTIAQWSKQEGEMDRKLDVVKAQIQEQINWTL